MGKRLASTPRSKVRQALRMLSLRSRERAAALKRDHYTCQKCGVKQSKSKGKEQKVESHHKQGIGNWERVIDVVYEEILVAPDLWETLCPECHDKLKEGPCKR
jgi:predicted HNH restriction endonuclease